MATKAQLDVTGEDGEKTNEQLKNEVGIAIPEEELIRIRPNVPFLPPIPQVLFRRADLCQVEDLAMKIEFLENKSKLLEAQNNINLPTADLEKSSDDLEDEVRYFLVFSLLYTHQCTSLSFSKILTSLKTL